MREDGCGVQQSLMKVVLPYHIGRAGNGCVTCANGCWRPFTALRDRKQVRRWRLSGRSAAENYGTTQKAPAVTIHHSLLNRGIVLHVGDMLLFTVQKKGARLQARCAPIAEEATVTGKEKVCGAVSPSVLTCRVTVPLYRRSIVLAENVVCNAVRRD